MDTTTETVTTDVAGTTTETVTTTEATTMTTTDTNSLHESPVFDYGNLSAESRADFDRILDRGAVEAAEPLFAPRIADAHYDVVRIRFEGRVVEIRHQRRPNEARSCLEGVTRVNASSVGDDATARTYANLSEEGAALFRSVVDGNASGLCYPPSEYPLDAGYVRYQGQYYSLSELHATKAVYVYHVRTD